LKNYDTASKMKPWRLTSGDSAYVCLR